MKNITLLLSIIFVLSGCSGLDFNLNSDAKKIAIKIAAKHLAYELAKENSELIGKGIEYADSLIDADTGFDYLFSLALDQIDKEVDNPVLQSDYKDLLNLIEVNGQMDIGKAKIVVEGFRAGLILRKNEVDE